MTISNYLVSIRDRKKKIVGRGVGSGRGKTAGRGTKGQKARKSGRVRPGFEGGQTPIYRRFPKHGQGFKREKIIYQLINLERLEKDEKITSDQVLDFTGEKIPVKILGKGEFSKNLTIKAATFSQSAQQKIVQAGGKFEVCK
jgi:large subunit ribosomal protein L15